MATILVIEDDPEIRQSLYEILVLENWQVIEAADGLAGAKLALQDQPDLILCDLNMPLLDGYGVLQALHDDAATARIPLLFMTASSDLAAFKRQIGVATDRILFKPFRIPAMLDTIRQWLPS